MQITGTEKHRFVCCDPGNRIVWFDKDGKIEREYRSGNVRFELWQLPGGDVVMPHYGADFGDGVSILQQDGTCRFRYLTRGEVFGCQPLENGNQLVAELRTKRIVEVTPEGKIAVEIPVEYDDEALPPHECMRMVRKTGTGYLLVQPGLNLIRRYGFDGKVTAEYPIRHDSFGVVELPNGNLIYTCMSGAYELDADGREVWSLEDSDVPQIGIRWLLGIQLLKNGNLVLSNWMGHGHHDEGIPFFEVTREKEVVWTCDTRGTLYEPAVLQILDEEENEADVCFRPMK